MDDNFKLRATLKTDDELQERINNREKYLPETVEAAVNELQNRGIEFSEEELKVIAEDMQARRDMAKGGSTGYGAFNNSDKNLQVQDPEAPYLYSKRAIVVFSILFSVLFGSVMLAINVSKTQNITKALLVVLYGFGFTMVTVMIAENYNLNTGLSFVFGYVGAYSMDLIFWKNYIGSSTLYRAKPVWIPLIVAFVMAIPLIILMVKFGNK